jgi:UDP-2,3-diacylglucosamine pyrophosphatase LpxH
MWSISDVHILDGGPADEFNGGEESLTNFLESKADHSGILNGDILELCKEATLEDILKVRGPLVELLFRKAKIYLVGNHDRSMLNSSFSVPSFMGVPIMRRVILDGILFMHGDDFDLATNDDSGALGQTLTRITGYLAENVSPRLNEWARSLEKVVQEVGRTADPVSFRNRALRYIEHFWIGGQRLRGICAGHVHQKSYAMWNGRIEYWNSGCRILGHQDFVEIGEMA